MGIRNRIALGFISLSFLLFIAGLISYFELARLNESTMQTVDKGASGISKAKEILDLIERQDLLVLEEFTEDSMVYSSKNRDILIQLDTITTQLSAQFPNNETIEKLAQNRDIYSRKVENLRLIATREGMVDWYFKNYKPIYRNFVHTTNNFIVSTQESVVEKTREIESLAYRATMQGITAIASAIIIILIFFYMIDLYFVRPVIGMTTALKKYLMHKTPFDVKLEGKEEVYMLHTYIKQLTAIINNLRKERNENRNRDN